MPELQRPEFIKRAAGEVDRLRSEIRSGVRGTEEVLGEYWENLQELIEDLLGWVSGEVERVSARSEEQRKQLESRLRELADTTGAAAQRVGGAVGFTSAPRAGQSPATGTTAKATAKKSGAKKAGAKKTTAKKSGSKKTTAKTSASKKAGAKKAGTKKAGAKKAGAKKKASAGKK